MYKCTCLRHESVIRFCHKRKWNFSIKQITKSKSHDIPVIYYTIYINFSIKQITRYTFNILYNIYKLFYIANHTIYLLILCETFYIVTWYFQSYSLCLTLRFNAMLPLPCPQRRQYKKLSSVITVHWACSTLCFQHTHEWCHSWHIIF